MSVNERIKELRKAKGLTMDKFGAQIGITRGSVSLIETGRNNPSDQTIRSICREFNVREEWLRTGEGSMQAARSVSDEIEGFLADIKTNDQDFRARLVSVLARLSPEEWALVESMAIKLADGVSRQDTSTPEQRARARADSYYEEVLAEEKVKDAFSASQTQDDAEEKSASGN